MGVYTIPHGYVPDVEALHASCDLIVLSSHTNSVESMPNALLEAMAMERAVVGTRVGGIPEIIRDGVDGRLVEPESPGAIVEVVTELLRAPDERRRLGVEARRVVIARHAEPLIVGRLAELLWKVIADGRSDSNLI